MYVGNLFLSFIAQIRVQKKNPMTEILIKNWMLSCRNVLLIVLASDAGGLRKRLMTPEMGSSEAGADYGYVSYHDTSGVGHLASQQTHEPDVSRQPTRSLSYTDISILPHIRLTVLSKSNSSVFIMCMYCIKKFFPELFLILFWIDDGYWHGSELRASEWHVSSVATVPVNLPIPSLPSYFLTEYYRTVPSLPYRTVTEFFSNFTELETR